MTRLRAGLRGLKNGLLGALVCMTTPTAVLALGWSLRRAQRTAARTWGHTPAAMPGWFAGPTAAPRRRTRWLGGFAENARLGLVATLTTAVWLAPAGICWSFSWLYGWDNSFAKGYTRAWVGPTLGFSGIAFFIAAMLFVPLAQARLAVTRDWRSALDLRTLWACWAVRPLGSLWLAGCYAAVAMVFLFARTLIAFYTQDNEELIDAPAGELVDIARTYWFVVALVLFPLIVALKRTAASVYAKGLARAVARSERVRAALHLTERTALGALTPASPPRRYLHPALGVAAAVPIWFVVAASIFVAQFFAYAGSGPWVNYPIAQVPALNHTPWHLVRAAREEARTAEAGSPASQ